jgi:hypothetical protein
MAPLCGKPLSHEDRKVWQQVIALLMGLKIRNEFGAKDLTADVGKALRRAAASRNCEDCGVKVASGAAHSGGCCSLKGLAIPKPAWYPLCTQSPASSLRNERE